MVAVIDEQQQWFDEDTNTPINNGYIYIGARNGDPRTAVDIYSDRELTTALANPQRTDSAGRSVNKIWIADRYSIEVSNSNDVQKYIELDAGESASAATVTLGNVLGSDTITATGTPTITSYDDLSEYIFRTAQINTTDAVTINIDGVGDVSIVKNHDQPIQPGNFEADQNVILTYNSTDDVMEWANQNIKSVSSYVGTDIASATTVTIPTDGDFFNVTGSVEIENFNVAANRQFTLKLASGSTTTYQSTADDTVEAIAAGVGASSTQYFTSGPQTVSAGTAVIADTSGGAFTVNLPASPSEGNFVSFEVGSDYTTNNLTVGRNSETIMGDSEDMVISTNSPVALRYNGTDWRIS